MIRGDLFEAGWADGLYADSGNGTHLVYPIEGVDTLADDDLIRRCLESLHSEYGGEGRQGRHQRL